MFGSFRPRAKLKSMLLQYFFIHRVNLMSFIVVLIKCIVILYSFMCAQHILDREENWISWKNEGCPSFIKERCGYS